MDSRGETRAAVSTQQTSQENRLADFGPNEWIVDDMYQRYLADPASVDAAWHEFFADYRPVVEPAAAVTPPAPAPAATATAPAPPAEAPPATKPSPPAAAPAISPDGDAKQDGKAGAT